MTATAHVLPTEWPTALPVPADGSADLWLLRVPEDVPPAALDLSVLDEHERRRASSFVRDLDRRRYTVAHLTLRRLLGAYLGVPAREVRFHSEPCPCCGAPHGRPAVAGARTSLHFSLSHGGDLVLVGVASVPIGVDVEVLPELEVVTELAATLHHAEAREVLAAAPGDSSSVFARLWVRKEAYLKGIGTGLGRDLDLDYLGEDPGTDGAPPGWRIVNIGGLPGHAAAAALHTGRAVAPSVHRLDPAFIGSVPALAGL